MEGLMVICPHCEHKGPVRSIQDSFGTRIFCKKCGECLNPRPLPKGPAEVTEFETRMQRRSRRESEAYLAGAIGTLDSVLRGIDRLAEDNSFSELNAEQMWRLIRNSVLMFKDHVMIAQVTLKEREE